MPGTTLPPDQTALLTALLRRVERLERLIFNRTAPTSDRGAGVAAFSYSGALVDTTVSPPWYTERGVTFATARLSLTTAAGSDVTCEVDVNGSSQFDITLPAGDLTVLLSIALDVRIGDYVTVTVVSSGGASNASLFLTPRSS